MKKTLKQRMGGCIRGTALIACFIAIWYVASCFPQPIFIPSPIVVWDAIIGLAETGQLQMGLLYSFLRITGASAISMAVAIPLALLIYGVKPVKETFMPIVSFLRYIPVTAFSPLLILWFGIGEDFILIYCHLCLPVAVYFTLFQRCSSRFDGHRKNHRYDQLGDDQRNPVACLPPLYLQHLPYDVWDWVDILRCGGSDQRKVWFRFYH